jgi:hypothetical protein
VKELMDANQRAGQHTAVWDGTDAQGVRLASGLYIARLETDSIVLTRKMILMR